jgi:hypothetical protein
MVLPHLFVRRLAEMADCPDEDSTYYIKEMRATEWRSVVSQFAQQQFSGSDVGLGSISPLLAEATRPFMSAMPPLATKAVSHSVTSRSAIRVISRRSNAIAIRSPRRRGQANYQVR